MRVEQRHPPRGAPDRSARGWVLYDAKCPFCRRWAQRLHRPLARHGLHIVPLQADWVRAYFSDLSDEQLLEALRVVRSDGRHLAAGDALIHLARYVWWLWPIWLAGQVAPLRVLIRAVYNGIAKHRDLMDKLM